ncbi:MAG: FtsQ-type POTRA domain-containing protein, partial [Pseudomonadota bacterium]
PNPKNPQGMWALLKYRLAQFWSGVLTYTAVGLTAAALIVVLMLFAGGYFWNIGERIDTLTGRAAKAIGFSVSRVTLKGGGNLSDRDLMDALWSDEKGSVLGRSLLNLDAQGARERVESLGWVKRAAVQKLWPNTLHVSIVERTPRALWQDADGRFFLIDHEGYRLSQVSPADYTHLPVVTNTDDPSLAQGILSALWEREDLLERTAIIVGVNGRRFDLRFRNDFTAKLPEEGVEQALDRLAGLGAGTGQLAAAADYIDLRDDEWAYLRPKAS